MNKGLNFNLVLGAIVVVAIAIMISSRGDDPVSVAGNHNSSAGAESSASSAAITHTQTGNDVEATLAPDFNLKTLDGEPIALSDYRGEKPVILDFFATWCHNCQRSMPKLSTWYQEYGDRVEVLGMNLRESLAAVERFVDNYNISFPIVMDPLSVASNSYAVRYTNYHVLINTDGSLHSIVPGDISEGDILALINDNGV